MRNLRKAVRIRTLSTLTLGVSAVLVALAPAQTNQQGWPSHAHDTQHTGVSSVAAQPLRRISLEHAGRFGSPTQLR